MSIQRRADELVDLLRPDFVGNDGTASPTFTDEYLTGSHRASVSVGVRVYRSAAFVHNASGGVLAIDFDSQRWDDPDDNQWAVAPNPTRLTCQFDGTYVISGSALWAANAVGVRDIRIRLNGATYIANQREQGLIASDLSQTVTTPYKMVATDWVELIAYQNSGGNLNILSAGNYSPEFSMVRVA